MEGFFIAGSVIEFLGVVIMLITFAVYAAKEELGKAAWSLFGLLLNTFMFAVVIWAATH